ncbi:MAG TPA: hypothetical protein VF844_19585 [Ktedonobacteraceae bacterium]
MKRQHPYIMMGYWMKKPSEMSVAWFDAIRWFGGSESAQFLLNAFPSAVTSGE